MGSDHWSHRRHRQSLCLCSGQERSVEALSPSVLHQEPSGGSGLPWYAGLKVLLVSRSQQRLDSTSQEIQAKSPEATIKTVAVDLGSLGNSGSDAQGTGWGRLQEAVAGLDIGLLINNVGLSYDHPEFFDQVAEFDVHQIIQLNVQAATKVSTWSPSHASSYTTVLTCNILCHLHCLNGAAQHMHHSSYRLCCSKTHIAC